jgi:hypothetical protein
MESGLFEGEEAVLHLIDRIVGPLGLRVDESSPYVDARLPDGSRFHDSFRAEPELYALEVDPGRRGLGLERPLDRGDGLRCGEGPYLVSSSGREQSPKADFRLDPRSGSQARADSSTFTAPLQRGERQGVCRLLHSTQSATFSCASNFQACHRTVVRSLTTAGPRHAAVRWREPCGSSKPIPAFPVEARGRLAIERVQ